MFPCAGFVLCVILLFGGATASTFEGNEHRSAGNSANVPVLQNGRLSLVKASTHQYTLDNYGNKVTYGDIVSLAGDHFGPEQRDGVVCEGQDEQSRQNRFTRMYEELVDEKASSCGFFCGKNYIPDILKEFDKQDQVNAKYVKEGKEPSTGKGDLGFTRWILNGYGRPMIYKQLYNYDHFVECARTSYSVGHKMAQVFAFQAARTADEAGRAALFQRAMIHNAMADHFLTDLFAAGHLRTPRQHISEVCGGDGFPSGVTTSRMHDEDNANGLYVANQRGDKFRTFGDGYYFDSENAQSRKLTEQAVQASVDDVIAAYQAGVQGHASFTPQYSAMFLIPDMQLTNNQPDMKLANTCPLFKVIDGVLHIRDKQYTARSDASLAYWQQNPEGDDDIDAAPFASLNGECKYKKMSKKDCSCGLPQCMPTLDWIESQQAYVSIDVNWLGMKRKNL